MLFVNDSKLSETLMLTYSLQYKLFARHILSTKCSRKIPRSSQRIIYFSFSLAYSHNAAFIYVFHDLLNIATHCTSIA